jgi:hypothetical protein
MLKPRLFINLLTVGVLIWSGMTLCTPVLARSMINMKRATPKVLFKPPASNKKPDRTIGAGVRQGTTCRKNTTAPLQAESSPTKLPLMALVPTPVSGGLTLAERPSFWVYLPFTNAKQVVLSLKEEGMKSHSQTFFPVEGVSGLKQLTLPPTVPPLAMNKTYQWAVVLVCGERAGPNDPMITAWIRRVELSGPLKQGTALEQASWYAEQGIWYDALSALAQVQPSSTNAQELRGIWVDFLRSAGLESIPTDMARSSSVP